MKKILFVMFLTFNMLNLYAMEQVAENKKDPALSIQLLTEDTLEAAFVLWARTNGKDVYQNPKKRTVYKEFLQQHITTKGQALPFAYLAFNENKLPIALACSRKILSTNNHLCPWLQKHPHTYPWTTLAIDKKNCTQDNGTELIKKVIEKTVALIDCKYVYALIAPGSEKKEFEIYKQCGYQYYAQSVIKRTVREPLAVTILQYTLPEKTEK